MAEETLAASYALAKSLRLNLRFGRTDDKALIMFTFSGGQGQNRTADTKIFSLLLYRLSYLPTPLRDSIATVPLLPLQGARVRHRSRWIIIVSRLQESCVLLP
jgi:hypothetical protein